MLGNTCLTEFLKRNFLAPGSGSFLFQLGYSGNPLLLHHRLSSLLYLSSLPYPLRRGGLRLLSLSLLSSRSLSPLGPIGGNSLGPSGGIPLGPLGATSLISTSPFLSFVTGLSGEVFTGPLVASSISACSLDPSRGM